MRNFFLAIFAFSSGLVLAQTSTNQATPPAPADGIQVPVTFSGGSNMYTIPAVAYATVRDGRVVSVTIINGGSGYSFPPTVSIPGWPDLTTSVTLSFNFANSGSVTEIKVGPAVTAASPAMP